MLTRKDYKELARIIQANLQGCSEADSDGYSMGHEIVIQADDFVNELCVWLKADNPRFNESKFREACKREDL